MPISTSSVVPIELTVEAHEGKGNRDPEEHEGDP